MVQYEQTTISMACKVKLIDFIIIWQTKLHRKTKLHKKYASGSNSKQ